MSKQAKLRPLTESRRYEAFIRQRDLGLQDVLSKYVARIDAVVAAIHTQAEQIASHLQHKVGSSHVVAKRNRDEFEKRLTPWIELGIQQTAGLMKQLRRTTYVLSYVGQAEAVGRATAARTQVHLSPDEIRQVMDRDMLHGGNVHARVELAFHRLLRDVVDAYQLSQVMGSDLTETLARLGRAFPTKGKRPQRKMAPMKESARDREPPGDDDPLIIGVSVDNGFSHFVTQDEWQDSLDDYMQDNVPAGRGPYDQVFAVNEETGEDESRYQWQVEQEMTDDFIQSVRSGEVDAANANGITDGVWISILDKKTCKDCCEPRDGLLSSEIEDALKSGDLDADACDAIVPPAHGWCRCRWAGATKDLPEKTPPDFGSWDDWLEQKAGAS